MQGAVFSRCIALCYRRPGLLVLELVWRWLCGGFLLAVAGVDLWRIAQAARPAVEATGLLSQTLDSVMSDPEPAANAVQQTIALLTPPLVHAAIGLGPLVLFAWAAAYAVGRTALLGRYDSSLPRRPWLLAGCEGLRLVFLLSFSWLWYAAMGWSSAYALKPGQPNLPLYLGLVVVLSVGLFLLWSLLSWTLVAAPVAGIVERLDLPAALLRGLGARGLRGRLIGVNLTMGVIKLALLVLATIMSATPMSFFPGPSGWPVAAWWVVSTLVYLALSDFFKLARFLAFLEFWREECASAGQRRAQ